MYKRIRYSERGALKSGTLNDLGHIVVICGKNNSGKSTLLKAIEEGKQFLLPEEIDVRAFEDCFTLPPGITFPNLGQSLYRVPYYRDFWSEEDVIEFMQHFSRIIQQFSSHQGQPSIQFPQVEARYKKQLKTRSITLIPPKRNIEVSDIIQTDQGVGADGSGLLNFLFMASN